MIMMDKVWLVMLPVVHLFVLPLFGNSSMVVSITNMVVVLLLEAIVPHESLM